MIHNVRSISLSWVETLEGTKKKMPSAATTNMSLQSRFVVAHQSKQAKLLGFMQPDASVKCIDMLLIKTWKRRHGETSFDWFSQKIGLKNPMENLNFSDSSDIPGLVVDQWLGDFGKPF